MVDEYSGMTKHLYVIKIVIKFSKKVSLQYMLRTLGRKN